MAGVVEGEMIVSTRYRDISYSELRELHPVGKTSSEDWELLRGTPLCVFTPPIDKNFITDNVCDGPFYAEADRPLVVECIHMIEIGD